jgi:L-lactate permease
MALLKVSPGRSRKVFGGSLDQLKWAILTVASVLREQSGGVLGKMVSPQNLAIGAAAVVLAGQEGDLFRKVLGWSIALVLMMCVLVYLQSTDVLGWMVVK